MTTRPAAPRFGRRPGAALACALLAALAACAPGSTASAVAATDAACGTGDHVRGLEHARVRPQDGRVRIVAVGSSSTAGALASTPAAAYPAVLERSLARGDGPVAFDVVNAGVNGDTLPRTDARLERDVLARQPQLVILQAGTNDAARAAGPADVAAFRARLSAVVGRLQAGSDVVLLNGQHYPTQPPLTASYNDAMAAVADERRLPVIDRYGMMREWIASGRYRFDQVLASDLFHPNDLTYACTARLAATVVRAGLPARASPDPR